jgi:hypothetical protein
MIIIVDFDKSCKIVYFLVQNVYKFRYNCSSLHVNQKQHVTHTVCFGPVTNANNPLNIFARKGIVICACAWVTDIITNSTFIISIDFPSPYLFLVHCYSCKMCFFVVNIRDIISWVLQFYIH